MVPNSESELIELLGSTYDITPLLFAQLLSNLERELIVTNRNHYVSTDKPHLAVCSSASKDKKVAIFLDPGTTHYGPHTTASDIDREYPRVTQSRTDMIILGFDRSNKEVYAPRLWIHLKTNFKGKKTNICKFIPSWKTYGLCVNPLVTAFSRTPDLATWKGELPDDGFHTDSEHSLVQLYEDYAGDRVVKANEIPTEFLTPVLDVLSNFFQREVTCMTNEYEKWLSLSRRFALAKIEPYNYDYALSDR
jgi:hypothetical protein